MLFGDSLAARMKAGHLRMARSSPPGMDMLHNCYGRRFSFVTYKTVALVITFWCYCLFHATRKPPSVVKRYVLQLINLAQHRVLTAWCVLGTL